jgi:serine/threonine-protein kinase OSR1/STK39
MGLVQDVAVSEIKVMCGQKHPNVLPMLCSFVHQNELWMVMPYIDGGSLEGLLKKNFPEVRSRTTSLRCVVKEKLS